MWSCESGWLSLWFLAPHPLLSYETAAQAHRREVARTPSPGACQPLVEVGHVQPSPNPLASPLLPYSPGSAPAFPGLGTQPMPSHCSLAPTSSSSASPDRCHRSQSRVTWMPTEKAPGVRRLRLSQHQACWASCRCEGCPGSPSLLPTKL